MYLLVPDESSPLQVNGRPQIYVSLKFCPKQPAITYTHDCLRQMKISHHPVAKQLPTRTPGPSKQPLPNNAAFRRLQVRKGFPTSVDALIEASLPPISLYVHSFQDATVVSLAWPHMLVDGVGNASLMRSWSLVMAGREEQVPVVTGARHDVLADLPPADSDQDKFLVAKGLLRGVGPSELFTCPGRYDMLVSRIKDEVSRTETGSNEKLYVSETDALTGWITQTVALSEPRLRPFTILNLINSRYHLGPLQNPNSVYLQNTVLITYTLFSAQEARGAAAALALAHREQAAEQTTQSRVISFIQWLGKQIENDKNSIALCGETDSVLLSVNALTRADLIKGVDFAPAVLRQGEAAETRDNPPGGTLMHIFSKEANAELAPINLLAVIGKDYKDRTLLMGNMLPQAWEHLEQQVKLLP